MTSINIPLKPKSSQTSKGYLNTKDEAQNWTKTNEWSQPLDPYELWVRKSLLHRDCMQSEATAAPTRM